MASERDPEPKEAAVGGKETVAGNTEFAARCRRGCFDLATNMQIARQEAGITQAEIAEEIGVSKAYICRIESNVYKIPAYLVMEYCRILKKDPETLMRTGTLSAHDAVEAELVERMRALPGDAKENLLDIIRRMR